jgi:hypothetical protein
MPIPSKFQPHNVDSGNVLAPFIENYREHFEAGNYQAKRIRCYVSTVIQFGGWLRTEGFTLDDVDDALVYQFLLNHAPHSTHSRRSQRNRASKRPALNHLVRILREQGLVSGNVPFFVETRLTAIAR